MEDRCVRCGDMIPEGRQVCFSCEALEVRPMTLEIPCRIGDEVWAIRNFRGTLVPQSGIVSEMFFTENMEICIVVKHIARGRWGQTVFQTQEEALAAIEERRKNGLDSVR